MSAGDRRRRAALLQAGYYVVTGVWPLVHRRSFERITGPKVDYWLVRTVGVLVAAIGAGLAVGARNRVSPQLEVTAVLAAGGLETDEGPGEHPSVLRRTRSTTCGRRSW